MRLLVLGGTQFLGRAIAGQALACGHDVTCAARGVSGAAPAGARFVAVDRERPDGLTALEDETFDAAIDLSRHPGQVRRAQAALAGRVGHWTFVSTTSVYADLATTGQRAATAPLLPPTPPDLDRSTSETYGAAKVACENAFAAEAFLCRPGLIVGPEDPTGRFAYWVARIARGGTILVPGPPDAPVQFVDVRDLASWLVLGAERRLGGPFDAVAPSITRGLFVESAAAALGVSCRFAWAGPTFLARQGIEAGSGPHALPYPMPDSAADNSRDVTASLAAGLVLRPLADTVRDTAAWLATGGGPVAGLTAAEESAALAAWRREGRPA